MKTIYRLLRYTEFQHACNWWTELLVVKTFLYIGQRQNRIIITSHLMQFYDVRSVMTLTVTTIVIRWHNNYVTVLVVTADMALLSSVASLHSVTSPDSVHHGIMNPLNLMTPLFQRACSDGRGRGDVGGRSWWSRLNSPDLSLASSSFQWRTPFTRPPQSLHLNDWSRLTVTFFFLNIWTALSTAALLCSSFMYSNVKCCLLDSEQIIDDSLL